MIRKGLVKETLLFLGTVADTAQILAETGRVRNWFYGWHREPTIRKTLSKMLSVGDIEKVVENGKAYYRLTARGSEKLKEDMPIWRLSEEPWDKKWRVVIFDIGETSKWQRESLRDKLLSLGFGRWQDSVYLSPFDIEEEINGYLKTQKIFPRAVCLVANKTNVEDDRELACEVWQLDKIYERHKEFLEHCEDIEEKKEIDDEEIKDMWSTYQELILEDPHLPEELLPSWWIGDDIRKVFSNLCQKHQKIPNGRFKTVN